MLPEVILLLPPSLAHAASNAGKALTQLATMLRPEGSLDLTTGFGGGLDLSGWKMAMKARGAPRFVRWDAPSVA